MGFGMICGPMEKKSIAMGYLKKVFHVFMRSKAEAIMMFFAIGCYMPSAFIQNLIIQKMCLRKNYTRSYCLSSAINETLEDTMQGEVAQLLLYHNLLRLLPAVILSLFMGQWCDKYGRKYLMIITNCGCAISAILYWLNSLYMDWPPIFVVFSAIPAGLSGEYAGFMLGLYGFIRDIHPLKAISVRVSTADGTESFSQQIGPLIGGQLYLRFGYAGVFWFCAASFICSIICTAIFVKDDKFEKHDDTCVVVRDFFDLRGFISCIATVFKKREGHFRAYILCVLVSGFITTVSISGFTEVLFLYTRLTIHWDVIMFNYYNVLIGGTGIIGSMVLLPIMVHVFHWSDTTLGLIGLVANFIYYYSLAFAPKTVTFYATISLHVLSTLCYVTFRSILIKCVSFTEIGKVLAVYAVIQAGSINLGQIVSTQIYSHTYLLFPGTNLLCMGSIGLICIALYIWIFVDLKKNHIVLEEAFKEKDVLHVVDIEVRVRVEGEAK